MAERHRLLSPRTLVLWGPAVLQMLLIFGASSLSDPGPFLPGQMSDKTGHFIGYGILGALVLRALSGGRRSGLTWRAAALAVAISAAYGVTDEFHQSFVPGRTPDVMDVLADTLGAAAAAIAISAVALLAATRSRPRI